MQNQKFSFRTKLSWSLLIANTIAIAVIIAISYWISARSLEHSASNLLRGIQKSKQGEVENYFKLKMNQVKALASFPFTVSAMKEFKVAHARVVSDLKLTPEKIGEYKQKLKKFYETEFIKKLNTNVDKSERIEDYFPQSNNSIVLQNFYIVDNPYPLGSKDKLNGHADASSYSALHARYHPIFRDYVVKFDFYDFFLIDPDTLTDVYTVSKEIDFGINFKVPGEEKTTFNNLIQTIRTSQTKEMYDIVDFFPYGPSYAAPAAFAAAPIFDKDKLIGILAAQLPIEELENIVTDNRKWEEVGLGKTGETFLVAKDYLLRSNPRLFIEKPAKYFQTLEAVGTPARTIDRIRIYNTAIALQEVSTRSVKLLVQGQNGVLTENNWQEKKALSAFAPLDIHDLKWGMVTTMEIEEIYEPIQVLKWTFLIFLGLYAIFLALIFFFLAH